MGSWGIFDLRFSIVDLGRYRRYAAGIQRKHLRFGIDELRFWAKNHPSTGPYWLAEALLFALFAPWRDHPAGNLQAGIRRVLQARRTRSALTNRPSHDDNAMTRSLP
jgi:hypothetical protein